MADLFSKTVEAPEARKERLKALLVTARATKKAQTHSANTENRLNTALSRVPASRRAKVEAKCLLMPESHRRTYLRAMTGKSVRAAITAQCCECMGWNRAEVARCCSPACSLYPYRPRGKEASDE